MSSVDLSGAYSKLAGKKLDSAIEVACKTILKDSNKYINSQSGSLAQSGRVEGKSIVWDTDYARRVFYASHRGSKHWFQQARKKNSAKWTKEIVKGMDI